MACCSDHPLAELHTGMMQFQEERSQRERLQAEKIDPQEERLQEGRLQEEMIDLQEGKIQEQRAKLTAGEPGKVDVGPYFTFYDMLLSRKGLFNPLLDI